MKTNRNHSNSTEKTNKDIRNNSLFTELTVEEEVFVRGGMVSKQDLTKKK